MSSRCVHHLGPLLNGPLLAYTQRNLQRRMYVAGRFTSHKISKLEAYRRDSMCQCSLDCSNGCWISSPAYCLDDRCHVDLDPMPTKQSSHETIISVRLHHIHTRWLQWSCQINTSQHDEDGCTTQQGTPTNLICVSVVAFLTIDVCPCEGHCGV